MLIATGWVLVVVLPYRSVIRIVMGVMVAAWAVLEGCVLKVSAAGAPARMVSVCVASVRPAAWMVMVGFPARVSE